LDDVKEAYISLTNFKQSNCNSKLTCDNEFEDGNGNEISTENFPSTGAEYNPGGKFCMKVGEEQKFTGQGCSLLERVYCECTNGKGATCHML